ncbi:tetratricopeptide repeat protein [Streptomyces turgidiscabies]|nr:tetratricopeptide repeat protein [Streptomyces turgidiscabies]MDX3495658.1 tetratricopeptide repeat protein [Streptomyces turgidiscabies]
MGGIGKTALAVEAAHQACARAWFPGGALFVDLRGYDDDPVTADQAVLALLDALGVRGPELPPSTARQYDAYRQLLAERQDRMLLILDNASDPAQYLPLLPGTDHHRVLITSRDRPDSLPGVRLIDLEALPPEDSAALITRALHDADERDDRPAREPDALRELSALCGHLPLALQIAAAMLRRRRHRGIASLVTEIKQADDPTAVLDNGTRGTDLYGRSLALRPILETSYRRLPPDQARLLRLLALAPGPDAGADAVAALTDLATEAALSLLEDLAATHLVTPVRADDGSDAGVRWRLHDLVRVFGVGVVAGDVGLVEEGEAARGRVLGFYFAWAAAADRWMRWLPGKAAPGQFEARGDALAWLDEERAGLVAAVQWAKEERHSVPAVRLAMCLGEYLNWRRFFDDGIAVALAASESARRVGDLDREARAWTSLGLAMWQVGRVEEAINAHTRARDLYQGVMARTGESAAWNNLGLALRQADRVEEAIDAYARARDLCQAVGDRHREGTTWNNLGLALRQADRVEEAIDAHTRAHNLYRAAGDRHGEGRAWTNLGLALEKAGRVEEAVEAYHKDLEICREFEDWYGAGETLCILALAHRAAHRAAETLAAWLQAAASFTQAGATKEAAEARARAEEAEDAAVQEQPPALSPSQPQPPPFAALE